MLAYYAKICEHAGHDESAGPWKTRKAGRAGGQWRMHMADSESGLAAGAVDICSCVGMRL